MDIHFNFNERSERGPPKLHGGILLFTEHALHP
jgi:hypothetical protein